MALKDLPGYDNVKASLGECNFLDFTDLRILEIDTSYDEDSESQQKSAKLILNGKKGNIEVYLQNLNGFEISNIWQLIGLDIKEISGNKWEKKNFEILDYENGCIKGYCENVKVSISDAYV